jgi:hypothetical protein
LQLEVVSAVCLNSRRVLMARPVRIPKSADRLEAGL